MIEPAPKKPGEKSARQQSQNSASDHNPKEWPSFALETDEPTVFGDGWISGMISAVLGVSSLGAVICFHFPGLTIEEIRGQYPVDVIRGLIHVTLIISFVFATVSITLRRNKTLGLVGLSSTLIATLLGGSAVPLNENISNTWLGLDWFVIDLLLYSAVYIPLERLFPLHPRQRTFRREWITDLIYFFLNSLLVQIIGYLTMKPAMVLFEWCRFDGLIELISSLPLILQVPLCLLVADLTQYWVHRAFHQIPFLWPFHAIHHSAEAMDWLAGSRLHLVDAIVTRSITFIPLFCLGFNEVALGVYVVIVVIQATFIHANVRWTFPRLQSWLATPCFHHWHHAAESQAIDKNFSVHSPIWDRLFGTYYMPGRWPEKYGLGKTREVPNGWLKQLFYPLTRISRRKG